MKNEESFFDSSFFILHFTPLAFWWIGLPSPWERGRGEAGVGGVAFISPSRHRGLL